MGTERGGRETQCLNSPPAFRFQPQVGARGARARARRAFTRLPPAFRFQPAVNKSLGYLYVGSFDAIDPIFPYFLQFNFHAFVVDFGRGAFHDIPCASCHQWAKSSPSSWAHEHETLFLRPPPC
jgi:hypothetical protein